MKNRIKNILVVSLFILISGLVSFACIYAGKSKITEKLTEGEHISSLNLSYYLGFVAFSCGRHAVQYSFTGIKSNKVVSGKACYNLFTTQVVYD